MGVLVLFGGSELGEQVKAAGGKWSKEDKLRQLPCDKAVAPGLERRVARR